MQLSRKFLCGLLLLLCHTVSFAQDTSQPHPGSTDVPVTGTLPVIYINTEGNVPVTQKTEYLQATYYIDNMGLDKFQSIGDVGNPLPLEIRGRGNSTWTYPKKTYKIKLGNKAEILGLPKHKHFALLPHHSSQELVNEMVCFELARLIGLPYVPRKQSVEVVLNGYNIGLYSLTENIKIDPDRVNIYEQPDENTDPETVSGGWLVEIDNYYDPYQIIINGGPGDKQNELRFTHKSLEILSDEQRQWLSDELSEITRLIYHTPEYDSSWQEKIDIETLAKYYIIQELSCNLDAFFGSTYLHKDLNQKWTFGPMWDSGWTFDKDIRESTFVKYRSGDSYFPFVWIDGLWAKTTFRQAVFKYWREFYPSKMEPIYSYLQSLIENISTAYTVNYEDIWKIPHIKIETLHSVILARIKNHALWTDAYFTAQESAIDAPSTRIAPITVNIVENRILEIGIDDNNVAALKLYDLNGNLHPTHTLGAGRYHMDAPAGYYILKVIPQSGNAYVAKIHLQ